jgi:hypothetical protein
MIRLLQILALGVLLAAGGVFALSVSAWRHDDPALDEIRSRPGAIESFKATDRRAGDSSEERPPLLVQAEAFALFLNPEKEGKPQRAQRATEQEPVGRREGPFVVTPPGVSFQPSFSLRATSYYPSRPEKSRALVAEIGAGTGTEHWVKQGTALGHFVVQEIRRGSITYRDGDRVREMSVERVPSRPSLVQGIRPSARQVGCAADTNSLAE